MYDWAVAGDTKPRDAIGKIATVMNSGDYPNGLAGQIPTDMRVVSKMLSSLVDTHIVGLAATLPVPNIQANGQDWGFPGDFPVKTTAKTVLDSILARQDLDGWWRLDPSEVNEKPFMAGLLNTALISYYEHVEADPNIVTAVKSCLDYIWANAWDPTRRAFLYSIANPTEEGGPAADLNRLIVSGFGWVYKLTGDRSYRTKGDAVRGGPRGLVRRPEAV